MKVFAVLTSILAMGGITSPVVAEGGLKGVTTNSIELQDQQHTERVLQDGFELSFDQLCGICDLCDALSDFCDPGLLADFSCRLCDFVDGGDEEEGPPQEEEEGGTLSLDRLCIVCDLCDRFSDFCDPGLLGDFSCNLCRSIAGDDEEDEEDEEEDNGGNLPPLSDIAAGGVCFSEVATVQVPGKGNVAMRDLEVGDSVLTKGEKYQTVYGFAHKNPVKEAEFLVIHSQGRKTPLEITAAHMVFVEGKDGPVRADSIKVGDLMQSESNLAVPVTKIGKVTRKGIYAPLTLDGTIVVDGISASNYISPENGSKEPSFLTAQYHNLVHIGLSPFRVACMGVSPLFCSESFSNADGMPYFVQFGLALYQWAAGLNSIVLQTIVFACVVAVTGAFFVLEAMFGLVILAAIMAGTCYSAASTTKGNAGGARAKVL